jgi:hypothetical protein
MAMENQGGVDGSMHDLISSGMDPSDNGLVDDMDDMDHTFARNVLVSPESSEWHPAPESSEWHPVNSVHTGTVDEDTDPGPRYHQYPLSPMDTSYPNDSLGPTHELGGRNSPPPSMYPSYHNDSLGPTHETSHMYIPGPASHMYIPGPEEPLSPGNSPPPSMCPSSHMYIPGHGEPFSPGTGLSDRNVSPFRHPFTDEDSHDPDRGWGRASGDTDRGYGEWPPEASVWDSNPHMFTETQRV